MLHAGRGPAHTAQGRLLGDAGGHPEVVPLARRHPHVPAAVHHQRRGLARGLGAPGRGLLHVPLHIRVLHPLRGHRRAERAHGHLRGQGLRAQRPRPRPCDQEQAQARRGLPLRDAGHLRGGRHGQVGQDQLGGVPGLPEEGGRAGLPGHAAARRLRGAAALQHPAHRGRRGGGHRGVHHGPQARQGHGQERGRRGAAPGDQEHGPEAADLHAGDAGADDRLGTDCRVEVGCIEV
mmetsp:Transcript_60934/g.196335  ORF Transcript_60934/g.196335 Transcript_60934/m.196335 type:complete len:235 (+) Transcript_60934:1269-1973(+)